MLLFWKKQKKQEKLNMQLLDESNKGFPSLEHVRKLISQGANVDAKDYDGWTPLHFAVGKTCESLIANGIASEICKLLIANGADINAKK